MTPGKNSKTHFRSSSKTRSCLRAALEVSSTGGAKRQIESKLKFQIPLPKKLIFFPQNKLFGVLRERWILSNRGKATSRSHAAWGRAAESQRRHQAGVLLVLGAHQEKFSLLTCSAGALGAQISAPAGGAGGFGEFVGRHAVHHPSDAAVAFAPPSWWHGLGFGALRRGARLV